MIGQVVGDTLLLDTIGSPIDTLSRGNTLNADSIFSTTAFTSDSITRPRISADALTSRVDHYARDSSRFDIVNNILHLWGDAKIVYQGQELKAGYLKLNLDIDEAEAFTTTSEVGVKEIVRFQNGQQSMTAKSLRYNFKSNKGILYEAVTQEGEFNLHGAKTKYVSAENNPYRNTDELYNQNSIITTCNAPHPHFGIRAKKLKVIPDELAVAGLSNLEIAGIPTPFFLPFGFFPLIKGTYNGLIFPSPWDYQENLGVGFQGICYYFAINEYVDLRLTADIYTRGTLRLYANTNYQKRYKYKGNILLSFARQVQENATTGITSVAPAIKIYLNHSPDSKAHPYRRFGGSIDFSTNLFDARNNPDFNSQFQNVFGSNLNFTHDMPSLPWTFTAGLEHRQNTQTRDVTVSFPKLSLNGTSIYPFKRKGPGSEQWYEKINVRYNARADARIQATDTTLFTNETLQNLQSGISHGIDLQNSGRILKYFNFTQSIDYDEVWFFRTLEKQYDPMLLLDTISVDTTADGDPFAVIDTTFGSILDVYNTGFRSFRDITLNAGINTQIFGTRQFKKGWLRGIRHILKPSVNFVYSPGTRERYEEVLAARDSNGEPIDVPYNPFVGGFYNGNLDQESLSLNWGLTNVFEAKYWSKKDSTEKKYQILRNLSINGGYNFAADSLNWNPITFSANTTLFNNRTTINFNGGFDTYVRENGRSVNRTVWAERGKLLEFNSLNTNISTNIKISEIKGLFSGKPSEEETTDKKPQQRKPNLSDGTASILDLLDRFTLIHNYNIRFQRNPETLRDTFIVGTHTLRLTGDIQVSPNWGVRFGNITYDIKNKAFVYPQLTFVRDLHCWEMSFTWAPDRNSYTFFIGVKSSAFSFVKYNYGDNSFGNFLR